MSEIKVYCDGGARGNPGPAAIGFVLKKDSKTIYKHSQYIGKTTNNVAEYTAVLRVFQLLINNKDYQSGVKKIEFFIDSQLVVSQLSGNWKIKSQALKELVLKIKMIESKLPVKVVYTKVPRSKNFLADDLVNLALDSIHSQRH